MAWNLSYVSTTELENYLRVGDSADLNEMELAIATASRAIDKACGRQFGKDDAPTSRYFTASYSRADRRWVARIADLQNDWELAVNYDSANDQTYGTVVDTYRLLPINAPLEGRPWTELAIPANVGGNEYGIQVTGTFGWTAVPDSIKQATLLQASRFLARRDSPYGIAGSPDIGSELRLQARVDPDVEVAIGPYKRTWWAV